MPMAFLRAVSALIMAAVVVHSARSASAQAPAAIDFEAAFTPDITRADMATIKAGVLLDEEQASIVEQLIHDYGEQFNAVLTGVREDLRAAQAAMGVEDPDTDMQREALREQVAMLFEEMQNELQNVPPGGSVGEIRAKYESHIRGIQARLEQLSPTAPKPEEVAQLFDAASQRLEQWRMEKKKVRERFVSDVKAILRTEQVERWPALDRTLLRQHTLGRARLQGEGVDLVLLARQVGPNQQPIAAALEDYELSFDAALRARNELMENSERELFRAVQQGDRARLQTIIDRITQTRVAVRNINDDAAAAIAAALPADGERNGEWFIAAYRQRAYPLVFRDTQVMRLLKAASEVGDLTPEQIQAIASLRKEYQAELVPVNEQVLAAVRQGEPGQLTLREVHRLLPPTPDQEDAERDRGSDVAQQSFAQRAEMGRRYDDQLQAILGEEAYDRLPRNNRVPQGDPAPSADQIDD